MSETLKYKYWPNTDGNLGNKKVQIPDGVNTFWPEGDALIGNFVYKDNKLAGFVDTKALTVNETKSTVINYDYFDIELPFTEGEIAITRGERSKYFNVRYNPINDDNVIITLKYKGCKTVADVKTVDPDYLTNDIVDGVWTESLVDLEEGQNMFKNSSNIFSFNSDLPSLISGDYMFYNCTNLDSFNTDLSSLTDGDYMFTACINLSSFSSSLSKLTNGIRMFNNCTNLTSFTSDLSSLTNGDRMFYNCKFDTASVQNVADTINTVTSSKIYISIGNYRPNDQETLAFNKIVSKGWSVYVNGSLYTPTSAASIMTLDETGNEVETLIPFYAKPVQSDEEHAHYIDTNGNFFNIVGAQFIYGDDLSTYGMFTCEEDAAANMRLTKIEKPSISKFALKR